jgi:predicted amidophosphoribosyltransferase
MFQCKVCGKKLKEKESLCIVCKLEEEQFDQEEQETKVKLKKKEIKWN